MRSAGRRLVARVASHPRLLRWPALGSVRPRAAIRASRAPIIDRERNMDRRNFVLGSAVTALAGRSANAQDAYPSHAITLINPFPPGGAADVVGRPYAAVLEPILKQPVVIETKAGAADA